MRHINWRDILGRLPLPTLALAASYGVYRFQALFTPWYIALVSAASFEIVYIGLAVARLPSGERKRAVFISIGAVVVSVVYNSLSALFEIRPGMLLDRPLWGDIALAVAHGAPLAIVAYLVADLLLHTSTGIVEDVRSLPVLQSATRNGEQLYICRKCGADGFSFAALGQHSRRCEGE